MLSWVPGGTGKSTGLAQRFPEAMRIDRLAPEELRALRARPERLREQVAGAGRRTVVIVLLTTS